MATPAMDIDEMSMILMTNLQLLGMDCVEMEGKYKIPFNKDMFHLPNKTGSEAVLHFLFDRLNPALCREQFRDCWPILDRKTELQFRKVCNNWLTCIQKDEAEAHMPRMNPSLLLSPGGRKFIHMLYSFSTYVLVQIMKSEHGWKASDALCYPTLHPSTSSLGCVVLAAIQDSCRKEKSQFFEQQHLTIAANRKWREYADELIKGFRGLTKSHRDLEHEKRLQVNVTADSAIKQGLSLPAKRTVTMFDSDRDVYAVKRGQRIEKARAHWKRLSKFSSNMEEEREIIQSVLDNTASKFMVDGTDMGIRVPGLLLREYNREIHKREIDNVYNGGRLNLVSVILLWNICLKLYKDQLASEDLPDVATKVPHLTTQVHKHHTHLVNTQKLREEMKHKTIPQLKHCIQQLQRQLNENGISKASVDSDSGELGLVLTAPTPPMSTFSKGLPTKDNPNGPVAGTLPAFESPDALLAVVDNVEATVRKGTSLNDVGRNSAALTSLLNTTERFAKDMGKSHRAVAMVGKDNTVKSTRLKATSNHKKSTASTHQQMGNAVASSPRTMQNQRRTKIASANSATPRSSKQKALDILADSIVDSVLQPSSSTQTDILGDNFLAQFSELDEGALTTRNLIQRTPPFDGGTAVNLRNLNSSGGARPKKLKADLERDNNLQSRGVKFSNNKKSPGLTTVSDRDSPGMKSYRHEQISRGVRNLNNSTNPVVNESEKDMSNNAAGDLGRFSPVSQHMSSTSEEKNHCLSESESQPAAQVFQISPGTRNKNLPKSFSSDAVRTPRIAGSPENEALNASSRPVVENIFNTFQPSKRTVDHNPSHIEWTHNDILESVQNRFNPVTHETRKTNNISPNGTKNTFSPRVTVSSLSLSPQVSSHRMPGGGAHSPGRVYTPDIPYSKSKENSDYKENSRDFYISPVDLSDRRPGDGQATVEFSVQPGRMVPGAKDNDDEEEDEMEEEEEERLDLSTNNSILRSPPNSWLHSSTLLEMSFDINANKVTNQREDNVLDSPKNQSHVHFGESDVKLALMENSNSFSVGQSGHHKADSSEVHSPLILSGSLSENFRQLDVSSDEKLTDMKSEKLTQLIDLEEDEVECEQGFDDSFVPFKGGIHLESPVKGNSCFASAKASPGYLDLRSATAQPAASPAALLKADDDIQAKLAQLQQKVSDILGTSLEDTEMQNSADEANDGSDTNIYDQK